jgi:hypothetical protein
VSRGIAVEVELVGAEGPPLGGDPRRSFLNQGEILAGDVAHPRTLLLVHELHLGAEGAHHLGALGGVAGGHDRDERVARHGTHDRQARPRVPARQLHDRLAWPQLTAPLGILDHPECDPVLLGAARVQVVELGQDATVEAAGDP